MGARIGVGVLRFAPSTPLRASALKGLRRLAQDDSFVEEKNGLACEF